MAPKLSSLSIRTFSARLFALCAALCLGLPAIAAPWLEPGDDRARHHLQILVDSGALKTPITGWPVMWTNVKEGLDDIEPGSLSKDELWSYQYLKHELRRSIERVSLEQATLMSNAPTAISSFGSDSRERREIELGVAVTANKTAFRLKGTFVSDPLDDRRYRLDGSYITRLIGNWAIGFGSIDRWWGPGWESSLILSHNARPIPGVFLQRAYAAPFESPLLRWLGPWQMTTFLNQLESDRVVENPLLWGMRVNFRPLQSLEIGLSRTAMWAGSGRPNGPETFGNLLIGRDNLGDEGTNEENEPGNQLGGVDFRWGLRVGRLTPALYGQFIGEDEAGGLPSRSIGMAGVEVATRAGDTSLRISLESQNTQVYFYETEKRRGNTAYEHHIYQSGYRYYGRPIGAATDNDTEATTLRSQLYFLNGSQLDLSWSHLRINADDTGLTGEGGSVFGPKIIITDKLSVDYSVPLNELVKLQTGVFRYSEALKIENFYLGSGAYVSFAARW